MNFFLRALHFDCELYQRSLSCIWPYGLDCITILFKDEAQMPFAQMTANSLQMVNLSWPFVLLHIPTSLHFKGKIVAFQIKILRTKHVNISLKRILVEITVMALYCRSFCVFWPSPLWQHLQLQHGMPKTDTFQFFVCVIDYCIILQYCRHTASPLNHASLHNFKTAEG